MSLHSSSTSDSSSSDSSSTSIHPPNKRLSPNERIRHAIDILQAGQLSLLTALTTVLNPLENEFSAIRDQFYACTKGQPSGKLSKLLDVIYSHPRSHAQMESWMEPHAVELVTQKVYEEMDDIKDDLQTMIASITPEFLAEWDIRSTAGEMIEKCAPVLCKILSGAAQTERAKRNNTTKDCTTVRSINDQSTNARIRGAKALRTDDVNSFTRLQCLQLGFGLFHLCMNLIWALLHVHRGSIDQPGSLSHFFAVLERSRLGCDHPDYHTLLAALMQILQGIILNAWKVECGYRSLAEFAASRPTPEQLCDIADRILNHHAEPFPNPPKQQSDAQPDQISQAAELQSPNIASSDVVNQNLRILTRDLLYVLELTCATSAGDFGRIEDMLGHLAMIFRGAGSNNYCTEILHFLFNLKKVWTPEFA